VVAISPPTRMYLDNRKERANAHRVIRFWGYQAQAGDSRN
jgi:hypothetical protein